MASSYPNPVDFGKLPDRSLDSEKEVGQGQVKAGSKHVGPMLADKMSKLLNGKDKEWAAVAGRKGPLQLLDLPMDVLKEIIKEVYNRSDRMLKSSAC